MSSKHTPREGVEGRRIIYRDTLKLPSLDYAREAELSLDTVTHRVISQDHRVQRNQRMEARTSLEESVARIERSYSCLRAALLRERNGTLSAVHLPPELLVSILQSLGTRDVFAAAKVCHQWRIIAISAPLLWTNVTIPQSGRVSEKVKVQLDRAASSSIDLTLQSEVADRQSLRDLVQKAHSITGINIRHLRYALVNKAQLPPIHDIVRVDLPRRQMLALIGPWEFPFSNVKLGMCSLRHLSLHFPVSSSVVHHRSVQHSLNLPPSIQTLHISSFSVDLKALIGTLRSLKRLTEVAFNNIAIQEPIALPLGTSTIALTSPLKLLAVENTRADLISLLLSPRTVNNQTGLSLIRLKNSLPNPSPSLPFIERKGPITELWIRPCDATVVASHEAEQAEKPPGITYITSQKSQIGYLETFRLPSYITTSNITSITCTGEGVCLFEFHLLPLLVNLAFQFREMLKPNMKSNMELIISSSLVKSCPHLRYLGISIIRPNVPSSVVLPNDNAERTVERFLESWVDMYGKVFDTLEIYDDRQRSRWITNLDVLRACAERFELRDDCVVQGKKEPRAPVIRRIGRDG